MKTKIYYEVLGLPSTRSDLGIKYYDYSSDDIKKAYKAQAMKWHPDKNNDSEQSVQKFQDIQEANSVLGDPLKRKHYDNMLYGRGERAGVSGDLTRRYHAFSHLGLKLSVEFMYKGVCRFNFHRFFIGFICLAEFEGLLSFKTTKRGVLLMTTPKIHVPLDVFNKRLSDEFADKFQAFLINEAIEESVGGLRRLIREAYQGVIAQMNVEDYFQGDKHAEFYKIARDIIQRTTLHPGANFNFERYLTSFDFSQELAKPLLDELYKQKNADYDRLFKLISAYPGSAVIKKSLAYMPEMDKFGLYHIICNSSESDVPTKAKALQNARVFYNSQYYGWLDQNLIHEINKLVGDKYYERGSYHWKDSPAKWALKQIRSFLADHLAMADKGLDFALLHQKLADKLNELANHKEVRRYTTFRDGLLAVIGVFLAIPLVFVPLLFPKYRATFFYSQNRKRMLNCAAEFKHAPSTAVQPDALSKA